MSSMLKASEVKHLYPREALNNSLKAKTPALLQLSGAADAKKV
jgi:hypothetical protein